MNPALAFVCCLGGIVLIAFVVSRITGARTHYLETFALESDERVLWEDLAADAYPIPKARALITSYRRSRRHAVRVTNLRILCGSLPLFGSQHLLQYVLHPSDRAYPTAANGLGGGLLTLGYETLVFEPSSVKHSDPAASHAYVEVTLSEQVTSSLNLSRFRIYTDQPLSFCLPESSGA